MHQLMFNEFKSLSIERLLVQAAWVVGWVALAVAVVTGTVVYFLVAK